MKLKVNRFRTRRPDPQPVPDPVPQTQLTSAPAGPRAVAENAESAVARLVASATPARTATPTPAAAKPHRIGDDAFMPSDGDDGFGDQSFLPEANRPAQSGNAPPVAEDNSAPLDLDTIRREGLTGRQLRMARRLAQKHGLPATSDFDAVRLLRGAGIDPFQRSSVLDLVSGEDEDEDDAPQSRALTLARPVADKLPQTVKPVPLPSTELRAEESHVAEVRRIQQDIQARRRRRVAILWARLGLFVILPTLLAGWYYFMIATPMYATKTEFVIQQSSATSQLSSLFSGTSFATSQDSVAVQGYLNSNEAMERLDKDKGFRAHFSDATIDPVQRLAPNATNSATYAQYKRYVKIAYDPTEGVIKMEVSAATPAKSVEFSKALIGYAEEQVDHLTRRLRDDQMTSANESFADAQRKMEDAQRKLVELQEKFKTISSEIDVSLITTQVGTLSTQLQQEELSLATMQANASPNKARMEPVKRRIDLLKTQIDDLRAKLTQSDANGPSIATVQSQLLDAQANVTTRQLMLAQSTTAMETSRIEANRQTRYLSMSVNPVAPDEPTYPRAFENTLVVMLIFAGIYLMISMTIAILREQVTG